jgi:SAM-dependent methyltransferase
MTEPLAGTLRFVGHNIDLGNGRVTRQESPETLEQSEHLRSVLRTLQVLVPQSQIGSTRIVDLGCLEGGYSLAFAKMGFDVLGIEAREDNVRKCEWVKSHFTLPNLRFVKDDARNLARYDPFDVVFCAGLLYHLDYPVAFIDLMGRMTRRAVIIHSHYAQAEDPRYEPPPRPSLLQRITQRLGRSAGQPAATRHDYHLSALTRHEGRAGRWYPEFDEQVSPAQMEQAVMSSHANLRSFWLVKEELIDAVRAAGFGIVYEQYDFLPSAVVDDYIRRHDRSMFVGVKVAS